MLEMYDLVVVGDYKIMSRSGSRVGGFTYHIAYSGISYGGTKIRKSYCD